MRGARELLAHLAASGKTLQVLTASDVDAFKALVHAREGADAAGVERARSKLTGACVFLRYLACQGELHTDEALFFVLNERIRPKLVEAAFGESLYARVLREAFAFHEVLASTELHPGVCSSYLRGTVKLLFFLARSGKAVEQIEPQDWLRFEGEVAGSVGGRQALRGARAYLRGKGVASGLGQVESGFRRPNELRALARLSPGGRSELLAFRERLAGLCDSARHAYVFGARELILFIEARGLALDEVRLGDWSAFEGEVRERGASWMPRALAGARRFLRERAERSGILDPDLVPHVTPCNLEARLAIEVRNDPQDLARVREVEAFGRVRAARGYDDAPQTRQGALQLLRFLAARGRNLADVTASDWQDFSRSAQAGTRYRDPAPLLTGASAYLMMKVEEGVLIKSPVPPRPVLRAQPPVLPESLNASLQAFEEGMAAQDLLASTRKTYRRAVWDLLAWASAEHGIVRVSDFTRDMLTAYRLRLQSEPSKRGTPYALCTQIGAMAALRFFFSWLVKTARLLSDPTFHLPYPRPPRYLPRPLKVGDLARLIRSVPQGRLGLRDRAMVELLWGTGMRRGELARLDLADVDLEERRILIRQGKGRKDRVVPLGHKAKEALLTYLNRARPGLLRGADGGAVFLGRDGRRLGENHVSDRVRALGRRIHLKVAPHLLRHSCATHLLQGRADIRHIQRLLGHQSLQTTEAYTKVEMTDLRGVIDRCHPRERDKA